MENNDEQRDRLLRIADVRRLTGLGRTSIFLLERSGQFPQRRLLTPSVKRPAVAWSEREVQAWIASRPRVQHGSVS
jgi:prophage regulatory protein